MRRITWVATLIVAVTACDRGGVSAPGASRDTAIGGRTGAGSTGSQAGAPCEGVVTLAVRGVDAGSLTTFHVDLTHVALAVAGVPLTPTWSAAGTTLSVAGTETPVLAVKRTSGPVDVTVSFGDVLACSVAGCSTVETSTSPITFQYDGDKVVPGRCHVFLQLDLASSVQPVAAGRAFQPRFSVEYW